MNISRDVEDAVPYKQTERVRKSVGAGVPDRPRSIREHYVYRNYRGRFSSADSVKSQNDCHRQSATSTSREMLIKACDYSAYIPFVIHIKIKIIFSSPPR